MTVNQEEKGKILRRFELSGMSNFSEWARRKLLGLDELGLDPELKEKIKKLFAGE